MNTSRNDFNKEKCCLAILSFLEMMVRTDLD